MPDFGIFRGFNEKLFGDKLYAGQLPTQLGLIGSENTNPFLLDVYPNASAAYSLRKLRLAYTGSAIRVRRASDNTEQDIGFVNKEFDTSTLTSFCSGTNGFVKTWYDQSGNARDATQATAASQPQIVSSGSVILENGKPSIKFDGNDYLNYNQPGSNLFATNHSYFIVHKVTGSIGSRKFLIEATSTANNVVNPSLGYQIDNTLEVYSGESGNAVTFKSSVLTNNLRLATVLKQETSSLELFTDSILNSSVANAAIPSNGITGYNIGTYRTANARWFVGNIQEFILYDSYESANRTGIETNINDFYSIY